MHACGDKGWEGKWEGEAEREMYLSIHMHVSARA